MLHDLGQVMYSLSTMRVIYQPNELSCYGPESLLSIGLWETSDFKYLFPLLMLGIELSEFKDDRDLPLVLSLRNILSFPCL